MVVLVSPYWFQLFFGNKLCGKCFCSSQWHHKGLEHSPDLTCFVSNFFPFAGNKFNSFEFISATKGKVAAWVGTNSYILYFILNVGSYYTPADLYSCLLILEENKST